MIVYLDCMSETSAASDSARSDFARSVDLTEASASSCSADCISFAISCMKFISAAGIKSSQME